MNWSDVPILIVIAVGVVGFFLMVAAFIMAVRQGGSKPATEGAPEARWSLPRRLMIAGASLGVIFGLAMGILFLIPGGIPWMDSSDGGVVLISGLTGMGTVWYFIISPPKTAGRRSEPESTDR